MRFCTVVSIVSRGDGMHCAEMLRYFIKRIEEADAPPNIPPLRPQRMLRERLKDLSSHDKLIV
jgi:hypothetical protein